MSKTSPGSINWIELYIEQHYKQQSRYQIDLHLLKAGCDPIELENNWQNLLVKLTPPRPLTKWQIVKKLLAAINWRSFGANVAHNKFWYSVLILSAILAGVMVLNLTSKHFSPELERLRFRENIWNDHKIYHYNFEYKVMRLGFDVTWSVTVIGGKVVKAECSGSSCSSPVPQTLEYQNMGDLFTKAAEYISTKSSGPNRGSISTISYNSKYGYVEKISSQMVETFDSNWTLEVTNFEILPLGE